MDQEPAAAIDQSTLGSTTPTQEATPDGPIQGESLESTPLAEAVNTTTSSATEQAEKSPLYDFTKTQAANTPTSTQTANRSLYSNNGKYSFVGQSSHKKIALIFLAVLGVLLIAASSAAFFQSRKDQPDSTPALSEQELATIPSDELEEVEGTNFSSADKVMINGPLEVKNQFVLSPTSRPGQAQTGQIYFDNNDRTFVYFDGQDYKTITTTDELLQGQANIGNELSRSINEQTEYIDNVVRSLQNATGSVNLAAGSGIGIAGLRITNEGVTRLQGTPNQVILSANTGQIQISLPQDINTNSSPTFSGINLVQLNVSGQSILSGTQITQLSVSGQSTLSQASISELTLGQSLATEFGGTGSDGADLSLHGVAYFDGIKITTTPTASQPNLCLVSTAGAPQFISCESAISASVTSVNTLTGNITIANADVNSSTRTITIHDATSSRSGLLTSTSQLIGGLKSFAGGIEMRGSSAISSQSSLRLQSANDQNLVLQTSGVGQIIMSNLDCSASGNGGKLTAGVGGVIQCAADTGGDGVGVASLSASDSSITVDNSDGANPKIAVNLQAGGGLSTNASGVGLVDNCSDDQILKYNSVDGWTCANDEGADSGGICATCVSLQQTTPGVAQSGHINISGKLIAGSTAINGSALFRNSTDSTSSFSLQNAAGASLLSGNTENMNLTIGSLAAPTTSEISGELPTGATTYASLGSNYPVGMAASNGYVYVITSSSYLYVLDAANPNVNPTVVFNQFMGSNNLTDPVDIVVNGDYLYILDEPNTSLGYVRVFDISNPTNPTLVTNINTGRYPVGMTMNDNKLYVINNETGSFGNDHIYIYDLADPAAPSEIGQQIIGSIDTWLTSVTIKGTTLFITDQGLNQVMAFDVSDPSDINELGTVSTNNSPRDISIRGNHAYVVNNSAGTMQTFDISNPSNMQLLHTTEPGEVYPLPTSVYAATGYVMLVTYYNGGNNAHGYLQLYNTSDPSSPSLVGSTPLLARGQSLIMHDGVAFVAGNYPSANNVQTFKLGDGPTTLRVYGSSSMTGSLSLGGNLTGANASFLGTISASNLQSNGYVRAQNFDSMISGSALNIGSTYANQINLNQNTSLGLGRSLTVRGSTSITTDSATALQVRDSSNSSYLLVDTSTKNVDIGSTDAPTTTINPGGSLPDGTAGSVNISSLPNSVAVSGDYAYVASSVMQNLAIVDISDPANPTVVGHTATSGAAHDVAIEGNRAYVAVGTNTVQVFDVSNPASPSLLGSTTTRNTSTSMQSIAVKNNYLYIAHIGAASSYYGYVDTFDMTNPAAPAAQGSSAKTLGSGTREIRLAIDGDRLYVISEGTTTNSGFRIINISDPTALSLPMTNHNMTNTRPSGGIAVKNGYAFIPFNNSSTLQVYDVSSISGSGTLTPAGSTPIGNNPADTAISESGNFLYIADETSNTLQVYNVADPISPQAIGTVDTSSGNSSAKSVAVATEGGLAYVVNNSRSNLVTVDLRGSVPRISLNQNTILATGRTLTSQGDTTIKTSSETAFNVQNALGSNILTVNTISGVVSALSGFSVNGSDGINATCSTGETLTNMVVTGGIITGGTCGEGEGGGGGSGAIVAADGIQTPSVDTITTGGILQLGMSNSAGISLNQDTSIASGKTLTVQGDTSISSLSETALVVSDGDANNYLVVDTQNAVVTIGVPVEAAPEGEGGGGGSGSDLVMPESYTGRVSAGGQPRDTISHGNYVYVSLNYANLLNVFDVSDPASPTLVDSLTLSKPEKMTIEGNRLYITADNIIHVVDITDPASPSFKFSTAPFGSYKWFSAIAVINNRIYVATENNELLAYNAASDVSAPTITGGAGNKFHFNSTAWSLASRAGSGYVYGVDHGFGLVRVFTADGQVNQSGSVSGLTRPTSLAIHGDYIFVTSSSNNSAPGKMEVFHIDTPTTLTKVSEIATENWPLDIAISDDGKFASVLNYNSSTLQAIDVSDPANPISVGSVAVGTNPMGLDSGTNHVYVVSMSGQFLEVFTVEADTSEPVEPEPTFGVNLNSNTLLAEGNLLRIQGDTTIKNTSETAFRIQDSDGQNLLSVDTLNGNIVSTADIFVQTDSETAFNVQTSAGVSIVSVDTANSKLIVSGEAVFESNITLAGHFITAGDAPSASPENAAGTGATCTINGNDTSGTITLTTGNASVAAGDVCTLTFNTPFASAPRPVISSLNKQSSDAGAYLTATTTSLTLSLSNTPEVSETYIFNYWSPQ